MTGIVALIPARAGSKRITGKNTRRLGGQPLINYTAAAATQSGIFDEVVLCSDSDAILLDEWLGPFTASIKRYPSPDDEPDIDWVRRVVDGMTTWGPATFAYDAFAILRPTSPFRTAATIQRAYDHWQAYNPGWHSLRAVERVSQHPGKMWTKNGETLTPLLLQPCGQPWHSSPTQLLPPVYMQTAGLEIAWTEVVRSTDTIAGDRILAFEMEGYEGLDLNTEYDWQYAEHLVATGQAVLPVL